MTGVSGLATRSIGTSSELGVHGNALVGDVVESRHDFPYKEEAGGSSPSAPTTQAVSWLPRGLRGGSGA